MLSNVDIQKIIPHRYPFLLVDRIVELEPGKRAVGIKNVTVNEPFFQGHFPGFPIMPGVLIVEALAQTAGIAVNADAADLGSEAADVGDKAGTGGSAGAGDSSGAGSEAKTEIKDKKLGVFASIDAMKFKKQVMPGDTLRMEVEILSSKLGVVKAKVKATVEGKTAAEGEIRFAMTTVKA
jgi:3-hydroxyacyl-[acyl-carrier-protein] dehydratase